MRILILHNRYQIRGGEDAVVDAEIEILRTHGHEVVEACKDNRNLTGALATARVAAGVFNNRSAQRELSELLRAHRFDVVHVHNVFPQWSPSVFRACKEARVPVVMTLHNYRLACPSGVLYREAKTCEQCVPRKLALPGIRHGCYRDSSIQTALIAGSVALHRLLGTWQDAVDAYIALTPFQKDKLVSWGLPAGKVHVKPNFARQSSAFESLSREDSILFVGRLSPEKGVDTLVRAFLDLEGHWTLRLVGDGPMREEIVGLADRSHGRIQYLGWLSPDEVARRMGQSRLLAFPSQWYEGFPVTIVEAFARGLPVMASRLGSMPDMIEDGRDGWLVPPGGSKVWTESLRSVLSGGNDLLERAGACARETYQERFSPEVSYKALLSVYASVQGRAS